MTVSAPIVCALTVLGLEHGKATQDGAGSGAWLMGLARALGEAGGWRHGLDSEGGSSTSHLLRACPQGAHSLGLRPHMCRGGGRREAKAKGRQCRHGPKQRGCKAGAGRGPRGGEERGTGKPCLDLRTDSYSSRSRLAPLGAHWVPPPPPGLGQSHPVSPLLPGLSSHADPWWRAQAEGWALAGQQGGSRPVEGSQRPRQLPEEHPQLEVWKGEALREHNSKQPGGVPQEA